MKFVRPGILALLILLSFHLPLSCAEAGYREAVAKFIKAVKSGDRAEIADLVDYPLQRNVPLSRIDTPGQFLRHFDEVLDEELLKAIANSDAAADWAEVGWRGIMFKNGILWLDTGGKISAVNYQTEKGKNERERLIALEKRSLHVTLREFLEPVLEWKTKDYRIRIDRIDKEQYRYAVWPVNRAAGERPDLILNNGKVVFEGSGGNHHYDFKSGVYLYRCDVTVIGADDSPPARLTVYKNDKEILSQAAVEVIKGR